MRKQFCEGTWSWSDFRDAYLEELKDHREALRDGANAVRQQQVTLVFDAQGEEHNNAVVLKEHLGMLDGDLPED